jgi:hypothetical protein
MIRVLEREVDAMETQCMCGAVGRALPPALGRDAADVPVSLLEWIGGNIGPGRTALEPSRGVGRCPACQHRSCVYIVARGSGSRRRR